MKSKVKCIQKSNLLLSKEGNMIKKMLIFAGVLVTLLLTIGMSVSAAPNFNNTVFRAEPGVRVNIRSNLNGGHDGWFSYDSGDVRILSSGHFRNGVEYFRVRYPLFSGGHREGFARRSDILMENRQPISVNFRQNTTVSRQSNLRTNFGTAWGGDRGAGYAWAVGSRGNSVQVIYRLDAGGHRMGWVQAGTVYERRVGVTPPPPNGGGNFTPRTAAPPTNANPWIPNSAQNPFRISGGNCTWYAWGRAYEILGRNPQLNRGHARYWFGNGGPFPGSERFQRGQTPQVGAIAVWGRGASPNHNYGHVSVVESVDRNGNVRLSGSNWGGQRFYITNYINVRNHRGDFLGFIYLR